MLRPPLVSCLLAVALCIACGEEDASRVERADGVVRSDSRGPGAWAGGESPLDWQLTGVFGVDESPEEAILGAVTDFTVDGAGNVYVLDRSVHQIVAFDRDGDVRWRASGRGQGPGELDGPRALAYDGGRHLVVANRSGRQLDRWSLEGRHVDSFDLVELPEGNLVGFLEPDLVVRSKYVLGRVAIEISLVRLTRPPSLARSFVVEAAPPITLSAQLGGVLPVRIQDDRILLGNVGAYRLRILDRDGELRALHDRSDMDALRPPVWFERNGQVGMGSLGQVHAPLRLASGHLLTWSRFPTRGEHPEDIGLRIGESIMELVDRVRAVDYSYSVDLFDADGQLLHSEVRAGSAPAVGTPVHVGPAGEIYTSAYEPFPRIMRYTLVVESPSTTD